MPVRKPAVRVAFAGAGRHLARSHALHLYLNPDVSIAGVFDPSDVSVSKLKDMLPADARFKRYSSLERMLADSAINAVMIGSSDRFHLPQLVASVAAGKHVFCEKPMCDSAEGLETLRATLLDAQRAGLVVTSCHPRRFDAPYVWLKKNLARLTKRYGRPLELSLDFTYHKPDPGKAGLHGGSMLQDHMNHEFDYLCFLFGMEDCTAHKLLDQEDRYHVAGVRKDGIAFSFGGTRRLDNKSYGKVIAVRFERATLHIDTYRSANSYIHEHETPKHDLRPIRAGVTNYGARFQAVNKNWIDAICGAGANYLTADGMLANSFMSVAFAQSSTVHFRS